ncbi:MAG: amino acid permease [Planctomycetota bacterium]|jgi:APA family basic amino acid/polyamine antiporter
MSGNQLFRKKSLDSMVDELGMHQSLKRSLGPVALTSLGVGAIIGTGIFVLVGKAAADQAGPAVMLSFVVAGLACVFAALCYAEFASMAPVAGSAYNYAYATLGELMAWIIGWDLILEYAVASSTVAHGWSKYLQKLLEQFNLNLFKEGAVLHRFSEAPFDFNASKKAAEMTLASGDKVMVDPGSFFATQYYFDLPAILITAIVTYILVRGIKESAFTNAIMVAVKVIVVLFVIFAGMRYFKLSNWTDNFAPYGYGGITFFGQPIFGWSEKGMLAGAALVVFAYLGFDAVSTQAEEAKNPARDLPIGIIGSLLICTVFYVAMSGVLTGMVPYDQIDRNAPVATAFQQVGFTSAQFIVTVGAIAGITSVLLVMMMGQPRIFLAMARDGLLPYSFFGAVHPTYRTPHKSTMLTGLMVATAASLLPLNILAELTSIGTLFAFVLVCGSVLVLRYTDPDRPRPFRCPLSPWFPMAGIILCLMLMLSLPGENWLRLIVWLCVGLVIYFSYGYWHSRLRQQG